MYIVIVEKEETKNMISGFILIFGPFIFGIITLITLKLLSMTCFKKQLGNTYKRNTIVSFFIFIYLIYPTYSTEAF
jgi:hypothetical protein